MKCHGKFVDAGDLTTMEDPAALEQLKVAIGKQQCACRGLKLKTSNKLIPVRPAPVEGVRALRGINDLVHLHFAPPLPRSLCFASSVPLSHKGRGKFEPLSLDGRGWSKGFAPHAACLRNGGPIQRATRPARVGDKGTLEAKQRVEISPYLIARSIAVQFENSSTGAPQRA